MVLRSVLQANTPERSTNAYVIHGNAGNSKSENRVRHSVRIIDYGFEIGDLTLPNTSKGNIVR